VKKRSSICRDNPSWFRPQMDIFTSDAQPCEQMDRAIPEYEEYPRHKTGDCDEQFF
jgi:hypothetical protein